MNPPALPAFADDHIRMLHDGVSAAVVDAADAGPVNAALDRPRPKLAAILVTPHPAEGATGVALAMVPTAAHPSNKRFR